MSVELRFPLADVVHLIDQAHAADRTSVHECPPALWWAVGDGVFLAAGSPQAAGRVYADGFGPGTAWATLALAGLGHAGPHPIALTGTRGNPLELALRDAAGLGLPWALLRLHVGHASLTVTTAPVGAVPTFRPGQDPVAIAIQDRIGDTGAAGRPWRADLTHPDDILADVLDATAQLHTDVTADLLAAAGQLRQLAEDIITAITTRGSYQHHGPFEATTARLRTAADRHEITANTAVELWAAWRNAHARRTP